MKRINLRDYYPFFQSDFFVEAAEEKGLKGMIGKGLRSHEVVEAMKKNKAVYFAATGGAGALLAKTIKSVEVIAYEDLGTESMKKMIVENFPATVVIDCNGYNLYEEGIKKYRRLD